MSRRQYRFSKEGKSDGFRCSEHRTLDSKNNIVVNVRITPANINDVDPVPDNLDDIKKRLGPLPAYMGVDAEYHNAPICHRISSCGIQPVVGYHRHMHKSERSFAEAKELHGLRFARMLGLRNMYEQSFLTAAVQSMKRIAMAILSCCFLFVYAKTPCLLSKTWRFSVV